MGETFIPFAYPGGTFAQRERDAVKRAGYDCGVIVGGRWGNGPETDRFLLKREPMLASDSLHWFKKRVSGFYEAHYLMADRKSTRLNSSHQIISYAVFCLKKKISVQAEYRIGPHKHRDRVYTAY